MSCKLIHGDCLTEMDRLIGGGQKVDLVLTDVPYGTTACKWDNIIPFEDMWKCLDGITYETSPILLFGTQPFISELIHSNIHHFKYNLIWDKHSISNPFLSKKQPLRVHEELAMFYKKQPYYNPQRIKQKYGDDRTRTSDKAKQYKDSHSDIFGGKTPRSHFYIDDGTRLPQTIISEFPCQMEECVNNKRVHPTQKPVALLKWLIQNYTKENDTVLDFTMGSGSTGVACLQTQRNFIGIELDEKYYNIAKERCSEYQSKLIMNGDSDD